MLLRLSNIGSSTHYLLLPYTSFYVIKHSIRHSNVVVKNAACRLCVLVLLAKSLEARGLQAMALSSATSRYYALILGRNSTDARLLDHTLAMTTTDLMGDAAHMLG